MPLLPLWCIPPSNGGDAAMSPKPSQGGEGGVPSPQELPKPFRDSKASPPSVSWHPWGQRVLQPATSGAEVAASRAAGWGGSRGRPRVSPCLSWPPPAKKFAPGSSGSRALRGQRLPALCPQDCPGTARGWGLGGTPLFRGVRDVRGADPGGLAWRGIRDLAAPQKPQGRCPGPSRCSRLGERLSRAGLEGLTPAAGPSSPCTPRGWQLGTRDIQGQPSGVWSLPTAPSRGDRSWHLARGWHRQGRGSASPRLCLSPSHGPKVPRQDFVPLHLGCPTCARAATPRRGDRSSASVRVTQSEQRHGGASRERPAGAQPHERGEGMLQTPGLRPLPPPRCGSYQLAGAQGSYGNGQLFPSPAAPSELSRSWRRHKDTEQRPGMSFVPVALLCSPGVLGEFVTHCRFLRVQSRWRQPDSGLDPVPSCGAPASSSVRCPRTRSQEKAIPRALGRGAPCAWGSAAPPFRRPEHPGVPGRGQPPCPAGFGAPHFPTLLTPVPARRGLRLPAPPAVLPRWLP